MPNFIIVGKTVATLSPYFDFQDGERPSLRFVCRVFAYKTFTYATYIHDNFPCLRWHISEIRLVKLQKKSTAGKKLSRSHDERTSNELSHSRQNGRSSRCSSRSWVHSTYDVFFEFGCIFTGFYPGINMRGYKSQGGGQSFGPKGRGRGVGSWGGGSEPPPHQLGCLGSAVSSQRGPRQSPGKFEIWCNLRLQKSL